MITNVQYLIQRYAEAREKKNSSMGDSGHQYWKGAMDTYHALLCESFDGWAAHGTVGYYVFYENMGYDAAHAHIARQTRERLVEEGVLRDL